MVEDVKRLSPELERDSLREFEIFADAHIEVVDSWAAENVPPCVAELAIKGLTESHTRQISGDAAPGSVLTVRSWSRGDHIVEPVIEILMKPTRIRIADLVTTIVEAEHHEQVVVTDNGEWEPALETRDGCDLPSAERQIRRLVHAASKAFASAKGQLVYQARHKSVVNIEIRTAIVQTRVKVIHMSGEATTI